MRKKKTGDGKEGSKSSMGNPQSSRSLGKFRQKGEWRDESSGYSKKGRAWGMSDGGRPYANSRIQVNQFFSDDDGVWEKAVKFASAENPWISSFPPDRFPGRSRSRTIDPRINRNFLVRGAGSRRSSIWPNNSWPSTFQSNLHNRKKVSSSGQERSLHSDAADPALLGRDRIAMQLEANIHGKNSKLWTSERSWIGSPLHSPPLDYNYCNRWRWEGGGDTRGSTAGETRAVE